MAGKMNTMDHPSFPGFQKCVGCESMVPDNEKRSHLLTCRGRSSLVSRSDHVESSNARQLTSPSLAPKKRCPICNQMVDDLSAHCQTCTGESEDAEQQYGYSTPRASTPVQIYPSEPSRSETRAARECCICYQMIDEANYKDHVMHCTSPPPTAAPVPQGKRTKKCLVCLKNIDEVNFNVHVSNCVPLPTPPVFVEVKIKNCPVCFNAINTTDFLVHVSTCGSTPSIAMPTSQVKRTKNCPICSKTINEADFETHIISCGHPPSIAVSFPQVKRTKTCLICSKAIIETDYENHVISCGHPPSSVSQVQKTKECIICGKLIDETVYENHVHRCLAEQSSSPPRGAQGKTTNDCIVCFQPIEKSQYEAHVRSCLPESPMEQVSNPNRRLNINCFTCNRSANMNDGTGREMPCHSHHIHCLPCLQNSMDEFIKTNSVPVCHRTKCDYELSRHDISTIPLKRTTSNRLMKLVRGQQRPQCSKCLFYIEVDENLDLDQHTESCSAEMIPCEFCQFPFDINQLDAHSRQCRSDKTSLIEKLTNFVTPRTKYPFTQREIRYFIDHHKNNPRIGLNPHSIVDALAVLGPIFPLEMPTRECDVCMERCPYDDIYVFDCDESHKLCYDCYQRSCETKMAAGEILTCGMCTNQLRDGEINQLRVSADQLRQFREYQMKKTFDAYSNNARGVIKCPREGCTWVAEAQDPTERFQVTCPLCEYQFCSLCNQQYHFRTRCQQVPLITQRWMLWCQTERGRYLAERAQQDTAYAAQLADYERQRAANQNRNEELRRRYDELMADEQYKAQSCRICPRCQRVVQRLEGCDTMICGQDAHGGNVQSGCGNRFNWAQAAQYQPEARGQPRQVMNDLPRPESQVVVHEGIKCDGCQEDVRGIRFDCLHCPSLTFCEKCEQRLTLTHSEENQILNQQQHVFQLIMAPDQEPMQM